MPTTLKKPRVRQTHSVRTRVKREGESKKGEGRREKRVKEKRESKRGEGRRENRRGETQGGSETRRRGNTTVMFCKPGIAKFRSKVIEW